MLTPSPQNAAYDVSFCKDVFGEIVSYLSPGWFPWDHCDGDAFLRALETDLKPRRHLQKTLLCCALTCRAWSDIALAELWKVLDHHVFLLKLLPWTTRDDSLFDEVIDLEPGIDDRAWSRFRWYSRLVRKMKTHVHRDMHIGFHRNTWIFLASRLQGEPLLPSLRHLQMPANMEDIIPFLFCLSPTIHTLTFEFECGFAVRTEDMDFLFRFLYLISDPPEYALDPKLRQIIAPEGDAEEIMHHLRTSARLMTLEELDLTKIIYSIGHASVTALSRLPSLRTLDLGLAVCKSPNTPFMFATFKSLRHLAINRLPLPMLSAVLGTSGLRSTLLQSIDLAGSNFTRCNCSDNAREHLSPADFQHHLALIRAALPNTLEVLYLRFLYRTRTDPPLPLAMLFAPFLTLNRLKSFYVSFWQGYVPHLSDDDLRALAGAWPRLEMLHVWVWVIPPTLCVRTPTVVGLAELTKRCPHLRRLTVFALDVSTLQEGNALPREGYEAVRFLDVRALVKDEGVPLEDVTRILDNLFPCLEEYPCDRRRLSNLDERSWLQVQGAMREMQAARRGIGCE